MFLVCDSLKSIAIPKGIEKINFSTCAFCESLEEAAFAECKNLENDYCYLAGCDIASYAFEKQLAGEGNVIYIV